MEQRACESGPRVFEMRSATCKPLLTISLLSFAAETVIVGGAMKTYEDPVVVEQAYRAPIETVWNAITKADQMRQWYFGNIATFEPEVGFETRFDVECADRVFPHVWKVTEAEAPARLVYDWSYDGYAGKSFVAFELSEQEGLTALRLTQTVTDDFSDDRAEFTRESCVEGWKWFIEDSLKMYLEQ